MNLHSSTPAGCIVLVAIVTLLIGVTATPAQNVPATALEAAKMPQFGARLAQSCRAPQQSSSRRFPAQFCPSQQRAARPGPLPLYSNGGINGNTSAWTINFGFTVSDTFPVFSGDGAITGLSFGAWLFPGDVLQKVEISITSSEFGGTTYFDQVVDFTQSEGCPTNQYGYNVCLATSASFNGPRLTPGTYWVNLQNAVVNNGDPVYWDENSGPSLASENSVGTIPSESFSTNGGGSACLPEQDGRFKVIHDFTSAGDGSGPAGVAVDRAGNLYGPVAGTRRGSGMVYKMTPAGSGWVLGELYNFTGGNDGNSPAGVMVARNGILYGAAQGGVQDCGLGGCGMIFSLRPPGKVCLSTSCGWTENVLYQFAGLTDAWQGGNLVSDREGNLYGVSAWGGAQQKGAVFELIPSIGGWSEKVLYSFTGGDDGASPTSIVVGNDGNLYGTAATAGVFGGGVVFELTPSGGGWSESVLYAFPLDLWGEPANAHSLVQDNAGDLFGEYSKGLFSDGGPEIIGVIFMLTPANGGWSYSELRQNNYPVGVDVFNNLAIDSAGNLFGTGGGTIGCIWPLPEHGYIFQLARTNDGWQYSTPVYWDNTYFHASGALALDAKGNLYGTTRDCGRNNYGTVWQFSP